MLRLLMLQEKLLRIALKKKYIDAGSSDMTSRLPIGGRLQIITRNTQMFWRSSLLRGSGLGSIAKTQYSINSGVHNSSTSRSRISQRNSEQKGLRQQKGLRRKGFCNRRWSQAKHRRFKHGSKLLFPGEVETFGFAAARKLLNLLARPEGFGPPARKLKNRGFSLRAGNESDNTALRSHLSK